MLSSNALLPLVYWYGHPEIKRNPLLMDRLIRNLGENVVERHDLDPEGWLLIFVCRCMSRALRRSCIWHHRRHSIELRIIVEYINGSPTITDSSMCGCLPE